MKKITGFVLLLIATGYLVACTSMGASTTGDRANNVTTSAQYNSEDGKFQNQAKTSLATGRSWTTILYEYLFNGKERRPKEKLPEAPPALKKFLTVS